MANLMDLIMQQVGGRAPVMPTPERQQMFDTLSSYGARPNASSPYGSLAPMPAAPTYGALQNTPAPMMMGAGMPMALQQPAPMPAVPPMPPPRPAAAPMQIAPAPAAPSVREGFMQRLLGGPNYQSNNMPVVMSPQGPMAAGGFLPQSVNYGDPESAADFFRADQAARQLGLLG
jgi:hypothetical protein